MPKKIYEPIGHHYIVEASGCNPKIIGSVQKVQEILVKAAEIAGAKVWAIAFSKFPPSGVSGGLYRTLCATDHRPEGEQ